MRIILGVALIILAGPGLLAHLLTINEVPPTTLNVGIFVSSLVIINAGVFLLLLGIRER